jgi:hypothetical protein
VSLNLVGEPILNALQNILANPSTGFNAGIVTCAGNLGLPTFIQLNWNLANSNNFYRAQVDPALADASGSIQYPFACLYIRQTNNENLTKFSQWAGKIQAIFEVTMSWTGIRGFPNPEAYMNCLEAVVLDVVNRVENQNWPNPITYNGSVLAKRGPLIYGAKNWRQTIGFSFVFEINQ